MANNRVIAAVFLLDGGWRRHQFNLTYKLPRINPLNAVWLALRQSTNQ